MMQEYATASKITPSDFSIGYNHVQIVKFLKHQL